LQKIPAADATLKWPSFKPYPYLDNVEQNSIL